MPALIIRGQARMSTPILTLPCPYSQTIYGETEEPQHWIILPIRCRRWSCDHCYIANEIALKEKVLAGKPERMLTLTAAPLPGEYPRAMHRRIRPAIGRLFNLLRCRNGPLEAVTFLELHKSGFPHYHALQRGNFIPYALLRDTWKSLTGNFIVDIRAVKDGRDAERYVTKYVSKQLAANVSNRLGRVVNFTRHYLPKEKTERAPNNIKWTHSKEHPATVLQEKFPNATWKRSGNVIDVHAVGLLDPLSQEEQKNLNLEDF